jgi:hypothetical protein
MKSVFGLEPSPLLKLFLPAAISQNAGRTSNNAVETLKPMV